MLAERSTYGGKLEVEYLFFNGLKPIGIKKKVWEWTSRLAEVNHTTKIYYLQMDCINMESTELFFMNKKSLAR